MTFLYSTMIKGLRGKQKDQPQFKHWTNFDVVLLPREIGSTFVMFLCVCGQCNIVCHFNSPFLLLVTCTQNIKHISYIITYILSVFVINGIMYMLFKQCLLCYLSVNASIFETHYIKNNLCSLILLMLDYDITISCKFFWKFSSNICLLKTSSISYHKYVTSLHKLKILWKMM